MVGRVEGLHQRKKCEVRFAGVIQVAPHCCVEQLPVERRNEVRGHEYPARATKEERREAEIVISGQDRDPIANCGDLSGNDGQVTFAFLERDDRGDRG
jgi:hypothetical protein